MPTEPAPARLDYVSQARDRRGRRVAAAWFVRHWAIAVLGLLPVTLWVGTYLYFRAAHSLGGVYASAPIGWKQIIYDEHYAWGKPLFYLHQPLAWLDQRITGTDIRTWKNDFHGNRDNYGLEAFH